MKGYVVILLTQAFLPLPQVLANATSIGIGLAIGLAVGGIATFALLKFVANNTLSQARRQADEVVNKAKTDGETLAKQLELDARNELAKRREGFEKENDEARSELNEKERRLTKREDNLDKKLDTLATKEKYLAEEASKIESRVSKAVEREEAAEELLVRRREIIETTERDAKQRLLNIANMSEDDAKKEALKALERECQEDAAKIIQRHAEQAEEESRSRSLEITLNAIQRFASEHTADSTVSAIHLPSDDMKGRVIGREGRNIRAFESATGVDVIVDDTPGVIVVSCFDPIRRAIASEAMAKLIEDGRIHPTRIEEVVQQLQEEMQERIVKFGKDSSIEVHLPDLHPRIAEMMGRLHYRTSYGQNILRHSVECAYLSQVIADQLGLDGELARRCGFLHDIGKAMDHEQEGGHPAIGMEFCKKFGERSEVLNAIGGHHNDIPATSPYTPIVMAADAISGARPGARRESLERYVKRLQQLEEIATSKKGVREAFAIQAGREVRVIVDPDNIDDTNCTYIARDIAKQVSEEMTFPGEIKVTVLREMRTVEYAR